MAEELTLKWGTLKGWDLESERSLDLLRRYEELGSSISAAAQHDTPEQKQIICELIDALDNDQIYLDWDGKYVTKDEAKQYVMGY